MPSWVRGRMNAFLIMLGQGGMALGAILWATGVANVGLDLTFGAAAVMALVVLGARACDFRSTSPVKLMSTRRRSTMRMTWRFSPTTTRVRSPSRSTTLSPDDDREQFRVLMQEVQAAFRRNGAFQCRLDESLDQSGMFRLEYQVSTWAEHLRQRMRMTVDETEVYRKAWNLHSSDAEPVVRHFRSTQKVMHLPGFGFSGRTFVNTSRMPKPRLATAASEMPDRTSSVAGSASRASIFASRAS